MNSLTLIMLLLSLLTLTNTSWLKSNYSDSLAEYEPEILIINNEPPASVDNDLAPITMMTTTGKHC